MSKHILIGLFGMMIFTGCAHHQRYADGGHSRRGLFDVNIISSPPGAIIEQEGVYLGQTPIQTSIRTVCPPFVNACRSIHLTATYHHRIINKTVKLMGRNAGDVEIYFDFDDFKQ